jgi:predicted HicB family RNase H-like nuclease
MIVKDFFLTFPDFVRTLESMEARMGRPLKGDKAMSKRLEIRVEPGEKVIYGKAAKAEKMAVSDWIRNALNAAANRVLRSHS